MDARAAAPGAPTLGCCGLVCVEFQLEIKRSIEPSYGRPPSFPGIFLSRLVFQRVPRNAAKFSRSGGAQCKRVDGKLLHRKNLSIPCIRLNQYLLRASPGYGSGNPEAKSCGIPEQIQCHQGYRRGHSTAPANWRNAGIQTQNACTLKGCVNTPPYFKRTQDNCRPSSP